MTIRLLLLFPLFSCFACASEADEASDADKLVEARIRALFQEYKAAIQDKDGEGAVDLLDSETLGYYEELLQHIRMADSASIATFRLTDKVTVLSMRHRLAAEEIWSFDNKALLVYAVEEGLLGRDAAVIPNLDEVKVEGNWAVGKIKTPEGMRAPRFHFNREGDAWKMNLLNIFDMSDELLRSAVTKSNMQEGAFLRIALEKMHGDALRADILEPVPQP